MFIGETKIWYEVENGEGLSFPRANLMIIADNLYIIKQQAWPYVFPNPQWAQMLLHISWGANMRTSKQNSVIP